MKERILGYLANGVKAADVATIMGCNPAYISQLLSDTDFRATLAERISEQPENSGELQLGVKYETLEHKLLNAMADCLPGAELPAITRALEVIAKRQESVRIRMNPLAEGPILNFVSVVLPSNSPVAQRPAIEFNSNNEVISINGTGLASMSSNGVAEMFKNIRKGADNVVEAQPTS